MILLFSNIIDGAPTDATSVTLENVAATFGVRRTDTDVVVVASGTAMVNYGTGLYSYEFIDPEIGLTYEYWLKVVLDGQTYYRQAFSSSTEADGLVSASYVRSLPSMLGAAQVSDALLSSIILAVSQGAERYCNRHFKAATYTEALDGNGTEELILSNFPIIGALTSLSVLQFDNVTLDNFDVNSDVLLKPDQGIIYINRRSATAPLHLFPTGMQNVNVTYRAGFETVPSAVQQGVAEWVADVCLRTTRDPSLIKESIKGYSWEGRPSDSYDKLSEPPAVARMLLSTYRNIHT